MCVVDGITSRSYHIQDDSSDSSDDSSSEEERRADKKRKRRSSEKKQSNKDKKRRKVRQVFIYSVIISLSPDLILIMQTNNVLKVVIYCLSNKQKYNHRMDDVPLFGAMAYSSSNGGGDFSREVTSLHV